MKKNLITLPRYMVLPRLSGYRNVHLDQIYIFMCLGPCCSVRYIFRVRMMFYSSCFPFSLQRGFCVYVVCIYFRILLFNTIYISYNVLFQSNTTQRSHSWVYSFIITNLASFLQHAQEVKGDLFIRSNNNVIICLWYDYSAIVIVV